MSARIHASDDPVVTRFVNNMMYDGKKSIAFGIFYEAMDIITKRTEESGHEVWKRALENVSADR
jgi:small subunit ribosomal protein S7